MSLCESKSNLKSPQQPSRVFPTSMKCPLLQDELEALEAIYNDDKFAYDVQKTVATANQAKMAAQVL